MKPKTTPDDEIINNVVQEWFNNFTNFDEHLKTYGYEKEVIGYFIEEAKRQTAEEI